MKGTKKKMSVHSGIYFIFLVCNERVDEMFLLEIIYRHHGIWSHEERQTCTATDFGLNCLFSSEMRSAVKARIRNSFKKH